MVPWTVEGGVKIERGWGTRVGVWRGHAGWWRRLKKGSEKGSVLRKVESKDVSRKFSSPLVP